MSNALAGFGTEAAVGAAGGIIARAKDVTTSLAASTLRKRFLNDYKAWAVTQDPVFAVRKGLDQVHHVVPFDHPRTLDAKIHLEKLGVDIHDAKLNGISLPIKEASNDFGKVLHKDTLPNTYADYVNTEVLKVRSAAEGIAFINRLRDQLISGQKPWVPK